MNNTKASALFREVSGLDTMMDLSLILAIVWVLNNDYAKYTTNAVVLGQYAATRQSELHQYDLIEAVLKKASNYEGQSTDGINIKFLLEAKNLFSETLAKELFQSLNDNEVIYRLEGNKNQAIWFLDSFESFQDLEADLLNQRKQYHRNGYFCIIYTGADSNILQNIKSIFRRLFRLYVINVNVFLMIGQTPYVYTYFPYGRHKCQSSIPKLHVSFRELRKQKDFHLDKKFFPNKLTNMYGCELMVVAWKNPPFVMIDEDKDTGKLLRFHGIEGFLLTLLSKRMNFTIKLVKPKEDERGNISENGTVTGTLKMVVDGEANVTVSGFRYDKKRVDYLLPTHSYMSSSLVVGIPKGCPLTPFQRLTKPFKYIMWSCLSSSILFGILVIYILKLLDNTNVARFVFGAYNRTPFTNLWNILFGGSINSSLPARNFARYLLAIWILYSMVLRSVYIGELFRILQDGRAQSNMRTIREVVNKNFTFFSSINQEKILMDYVSGAIVNSFENSNQTVFQLFEQLQNVESKYVVLIAEKIIKYYNRMIVSNVNGRVDILPETLITIPITMYMRRHSYLLHFFNNMLLYIISAGLISKEISYLLHDSFGTIRHEQMPIPLSLWLLLGLFSVYSVLLLFCTLVFLLELWSQRSPLTRSILNFFNC